MKKSNRKMKDFVTALIAIVAHPETSDRDKIREIDELIITVQDDL